MMKLTRFSNNNNYKHTSVIGRFKHDARCKRHPKHTQSPGVCSLCLSHKLTQISSSSSSSSRPLPPPSSSSSLSSLSSDYSSSNSASSSASPVHPPHSSASTSISFFNANHGLNKSRSLAYVPTHTHTHHCNNNTTKKTGFFFNLLRPRNKRLPNALLHSRSFAATHNNSNHNNVAVPTT